MSGESVPRVGSRGAGDRKTGEHRCAGTELETSKSTGAGLEKLISGPAPSI